MSAVYDERKTPLFAPSAPVSGFIRLARVFSSRILAWRRYQVTYRKLAELDDRQLADIGLGRGELEAAANGNHQAVRAA